MHKTAIGSTSTVDEEIEGLDPGEGNDLGQYPIDSLLIRNENRTVFEVVRRMKAGMYILNPDFQRDFVWPPEKQSKLIESALMRIPLPVFYLAEQPDGKVVVVDGLQRLTTFYRYLNNEFRLSGLKDPEQVLNKKYFRDLSPRFQTRIEDTNLILYLIDSKVPERARLDIFDRVNSGVALSRQQMRNCLYVGPATRWLKEQATSEWFATATGGSLNTKTMRDREAINRFCGFMLLGVDRYRGDMDDFLAETLKAMNELDEAQLDRMTQDFERSMRHNFTVFGRHAFRKHAADSTNRNVINIALFDVFAVQMTKYDAPFVEANAEAIHTLFFGLMEDEQFNRAIMIATNSVRQVRDRFAIIQERFQELEAC
ncbi:MAG: DUF262 domain-containing protein [Chloroflexaceae bacterium]|nr:DUF262 domain-containing protein [Chloroflexaceae bacterium]